ncbi:MAG TPA: hypothetical protein VFM25_01100 [Verrucomicrobiae bacterium]|nr:hypothetical protein [Verrucomicrobiae bacterium]
MKPNLIGLRVGDMSSTQRTAMRFSFAWKLTQFMFASCFVIFAFGGCEQHSVQAPPDGKFRLAVDDMAKDAKSRLASLKILSSHPGSISIGTGNLRDNVVSGLLLRSSSNRLWEARSIFVANQLAQSHGSNAMIQVRLEIQTDGGDGDMLVGGMYQSANTSVFTVSKETKFESFLDMTATSGVYSLGMPLKIGRMNGEDLLLLVKNPQK